MGSSLVEEEIPSSGGVWEEKVTVSSSVVCCNYPFSVTCVLPLVVLNLPKKHSSPGVFSCLLMRAGAQKLPGSKSACNTSMNRPLTM